MTEKQFPILGAKGKIKSVPWRLVEPHREQAMQNHRQSLEQLASRGGLCWVELFAVMQDWTWHEFEQFTKTR
ncbi:conserved hypothetical protein [Roseibium sp. TrichSKD4]|nr:conserved hypothetical protein [Roseibium sp. TrichSKD4]